MHTCNTMVWVHSVPQYVKIEYCACTHVMCFGDTMSIPVPVRNPTCWLIYIMHLKENIVTSSQTSLVGLYVAGSLLNWWPPNRGFLTKSKNKKLCLFTYLLCHQEAPVHLPTIPNAKIANEKILHAIRRLVRGFCVSEKALDEVTFA